MGTFYVTIQVADGLRERYVNVDAMVDTGSTYTSLPESLLAELGIEREETDIFELADNRLVEYDMGETRVRLEGRELTVPVVFAHDDSTPLVGATDPGDPAAGHRPGCGKTGAGNGVSEVSCLRQSLPRTSLLERIKESVNFLGGAEVALESHPILYFFCVQVSPACMR